MRNISKINLGGEIYEIKDRTVPFEAGSGENSAAHKTGSAVAAGMNSVAE